MDNKPELTLIDLEIIEQALQERIEWLEGSLWRHAREIARTKSTLGKIEQSTQNMEISL